MREKEKTKKRGLDKEGREESVEANVSARERKNEIQRKRERKHNEDVALSLIVCYCLKKS